MCARADDPSQHDVTPAAVEALARAIDAVDLLQRPDLGDLPIASDDAATLVLAALSPADRLAIAGITEERRKAGLARDSILLGIRDLAEMLVEGWDDGFPTQDGSFESDLIERLRNALGGWAALEGAP